MMKKKKVESKMKRDSFYKNSEIVRVNVRKVKRISGTQANMLGYGSENEWEIERLWIKKRTKL